MPDEQEGFVAGWIVKEEGDVSTVALESGEQVSRVHEARMSYRSTLKLILLPCNSSDKFHRSSSPASTLPRSMAQRTSPTSPT